MEREINLGRVPEFKYIENETEAFKELIVNATKILSEKMVKAKTDQACEEWWDTLIKDWIKEKKLPLYIRKFNDKYPRGSEVIHNSGRVLIPCDNGPAHWAFSMCFNDNLLSLPEIANFISSDQIPIAFALKGKEKSSKYIFTKHEIDNPNNKGWKIAHIEPVGLKTRKPLEEIEIKKIETHFFHFMNPKNMFLFPLKYAGLAEVEEVINVFKKDKYYFSDAG